MNLELVIPETTPNVDESNTRFNQSVNEFWQKQDLAHTLNSNNNEMIVCDNDNNLSKDVSELHKSGHKEEVKRRRTRRSKKRKKWQMWRTKKFQWSEGSGHDVKRQMKIVERGGQPLAPYNTTQFIMNDHNCDKEIDFEAIRGRIQRIRRNDDNDNNDDDFYSSPEDESDYLQQQFHEAYDNIHAERLNSMNKNELVQEYLQLEDRVEDLEKRLKESKASPRTTSNSEVQTEHSSDVNDNDSGTEFEEHFARKADIFQQEIKKLSEENTRLRCDNERLQRILNETLRNPDSSNH